MKKLVAIVLTLVMMVSVLAGCSSKKTEEAVLTINDTKIMANEVNLYLRQIESIYEQNFGPSIWDMEVDGKTLAEQAKDGVKDTVIRMNILLDKAKTMNIAPTAEEQTTLDTQAKTFFEGLDPAVVKANGFTQELVNKVFLCDYVSNKIFEKETANTVIDDTKLQESLAADADYVKITTIGVDTYKQKVRAQHILIKTIDDANQPLSDEKIAEAKATAEKVLEMAKSGTDFAALVTQYSQDTGSVEAGGEYTFGRGEMVTEFEDTAFSMKVGEISEIVETTYGYHIIKLNEIIAPTAEDVQTAKDELTTIEDKYKNNQKMEAFDTIIEGWKADYKIVLNDKVWATIVLQRSDATSGAAVETTETTTPAGTN